MIIGNHIGLYHCINILNKKQIKDTWKTIALGHQFPTLVLEYLRVKGFSVPLDRLVHVRSVSGKKKKSISCINIIWFLWLMHTNSFPNHNVLLLLSKVRWKNSITITSTNKMYHLCYQHHLRMWNTHSSVSSLVKQHYLYVRKYPWKRNQINKWMNGWMGKILKL